MGDDAAARRPCAAMREWRSLPPPQTKAAPTPRAPPMHFDLTDLRLFLHVAEAGSITAGAARSGLALASASARVRGMEEQAGVALLERGRRGVEPTPAGRALLHHARLVAQQIERMRGELGEYARGLKGHVRLLANTAAMAEFLPEVAGRVPGREPQRGHRPRRAAEHGGGARRGRGAGGRGRGRRPRRPLGIGVLPVPGRPAGARRCRPGTRCTAAGGSPSPKRSGASSWACPATARSNGTSPGTRRARAAGCGCASGCAGWTRPAAWRRSARASAVVPEAAARRWTRGGALGVVRLDDPWAERRLLVVVRRLDALPVARAAAGGTSRPGCLSEAAPPRRLPVRGGYLLAPWHVPIRQTPGAAGGVPRPAQQVDAQAAQAVRVRLDDRVQPQEGAPHPPAALGRAAPCAGSR